jgi:hypothetical protein
VVWAVFVGSYESKREVNVKLWYNLVKELYLNEVELVLWVGAIRRRKVPGQK